MELAEEKAALSIYGKLFRHATITDYSKSGGEISRINYDAET
jgi:hypothetical protein